VALSREDARAIADEIARAMRGVGGGTPSAPATTGAAPDYADSNVQLDQVRENIERINALQVEQNRMTDYQREQLRSIKDWESDRVVAASEALILSEQKLDALREQRRAVEDMGALDADLAVQQQAVAEARRLFEEESNKNHEEYSKEASDAARALLIEELRKTQAIKEQRSEHEGVLVDLNRQIDLEEEIRRQKRAEGEALAEVRDATDTILGKIGLSSRAYENSFFRKIEEGGVGNSIAEMAETMGTAVTPMNLMANLSGKIFEATLNMIGSQDQAQASFQKATGAGASYNSVINDARQNNVMYGTTMEEAGKATQNLFQQFRGFSTLGEEARGVATNLTVQLEAIGVDSATSAKNFNLLRSVLKKGVGESKEAIMKLQGAAKALDISFEEMQSGFGDAMSTVAVYGDRAVEQFVKLSAAAKNAGVEVSDLLGFAKQFDTFQDAAGSVSRLNAILGGPYLNSLKMVHMTEEERVRATIQAIELSGRQFSQLSRFEQKAIASAAGITDMAKANQILGQSLSSYDAMQSKGAANAMTQKEMKEQAQLTRTAMEKITAAINGLVVGIQPLLTAFSYLFYPFQWVASQGPIVMTIFYAIAAAVAVWTSSQALLNIALSTTSKRIGVVMVVLALLSALLHWKGSPEFYLIFGVMAGGVFLLGRAFGSINGPAIAGAGALALVAASASLLFASIANLYTAMKDLTGPQILGGLVTLVSAMGGLVAVVSALANPFAMLGALVLSGMFLTIGASMALAAPAVEALEGTIEAVGGMNPSASKALSESFSIVERVLEVADDSTALKDGSLTAALKELKGAVTALSAPATATAAAAPREIKLYMDTQGRRQFARGIVDDMTDAMGQKLNILRS